MTTPGYLNLLSNGELENRVKILKQMLQNCVLCPHQCGVNRLVGERGYCKTLENAVVSAAHIVPQIIEAIFIGAEKGLNIPIVYNSNGYDLTDTLRLLEGIVDIYMPDIKFYDDDIAEKYLGVKNYYTIAKAAVKEMYRQVGNLKTDDRNIAYKGLLIRHLVMPENLAGTEKIMNFIAEEISKDTYVNIMAQYYPAYKAHEFNKLSRRIDKKEYEIAVNSAKTAGLTRCKSSI
ncbi:radical SAM protein [Clostridium sp. ZS2-4]|uniref:radical SAM protein n=1 Tax=Clostridium sp. ZS2-4 TaxID=2987703 RepID=UPI00227A5A6D|nr:radical SAM protein [Clostridium sp. ZS2-4]MCY6354577.1 radical SAM protein [Clostridium sp. ZS2-4]